MCIDESSWFNNLNTRAGYGPVQTDPQHRASDFWGPILWYLLFLFFLKKTLGLFPSSNNGSQKSQNPFIFLLLMAQFIRIFLFCVLITLDAFQSYNSHKFFAIFQITFILYSPTFYKLSLTKFVFNSALLCPVSTNNSFKNISSQSLRIELISME